MNATKFSIIIPCYNERKTIKILIEKALKAGLPNSWEKEIIVVDDGSTDGTKDILENLKRRTGLMIIFHKKNMGKGAAVKSGLKKARGDYIIIQDADLELNPENYADLLGPVIDGKANIVFGSRNLGRNITFPPSIYFLGGMILTGLFNLLFGKKFTDINCCYKIFPKSLAPKIMSLPSNDFVFDGVELTYVLALSGSVIEVPVNYKGRTKKEGKKIGFKDAIRFILAMIKIRLIGLNSKVFQPK